MIKLKSLLKEEYYHITRKSNLHSIKKFGIKPNIPSDMVDDNVVYLFKDRDSAEDALMNWFGDRFDEDEKLVLLTISPIGINIVPSEAEYEVKSYETIPSNNIIKVEKL